MKLSSRILAVFMTALIILLSATGAAQAVPVKADEQRDVISLTFKSWTSQDVEDTLAALIAKGITVVTDGGLTVTASNVSSVAQNIVAGVDTIAAGAIADECAALGASDPLIAAVISAGFVAGGAYELATSDSDLWHYLSRSEYLEYCFRSAFQGNEAALSYIYSTYTANSGSAASYLDYDRATHLLFATGLYQQGMFNTPAITSYPTGVRGVNIFDDSLYASSSYAYAGMSTYTVEYVHNGVAVPVGSYESPLTSVARTADYLSAQGYSPDLTSFLALTPLPFVVHTLSDEYWPYFGYTPYSNLTNQYYNPAYTIASGSTRPQVIFNRQTGVCLIGYFDLTGDYTGLFVSDASASMQNVYYANLFETVPSDYLFGSVYRIYLDDSTSFSSVEAATHALSLSGSTFSTTNLYDTEYAALTVPSVVYNNDIGYWAFVNYMYRQSSRSCPYVYGYLMLSDGQPTNLINLYNSRSELPFYAVLTGGDWYYVGSDGHLVQYDWANPGYITDTTTLTLPDDATDTVIPSYNYYVTINVFPGSDSPDDPGAPVALDPTGSPATNTPAQSPVTPTPTPTPGNWWDDVWNPLDVLGDLVTDYDFPNPLEVGDYVPVFPTVPSDVTGFFEDFNGPVSDNPDEDGWYTWIANFMGVLPDGFIGKVWLLVFAGAVVALFVKME